MIQMDYTAIKYMYGFMRLVDLSIDRGRWQNWKDAREYIKEHAHPSKLTNVLLKYKENINCNTNSNIIGCATKLILWVMKRLRILHCFNDFELQECLALSAKLSELLKGRQSQFPIEAESLRHEFAIYYIDKLEPLLSYDDRERLMRIEHFMQNGATTVSLMPYEKDALAEVD